MDQWTIESRAKILKLLRLLGSDQVGERASAGLKANDLAKKFGGWDAIVSIKLLDIPKSYDDEQIEVMSDEALLDHTEHLGRQGLTKWEIDFVEDVRRSFEHWNKFTPKQRSILERIEKKLRTNNAT